MLSQDPRPGGKAEKGSTVKLTVAKEPAAGRGPRRRPARPRTTRSTRSRTRASAWPRKARTSTTPTQDGVVLSQSPSGGKAKRGSKVTITVGTFDRRHDRADTDAPGHG